jgi:predicted RNA binding protein YcfA (HicA-like mRNA interferase family)
MPSKQTDIERGLKNKGFLLAESHHHYFIYHSIAGKKTTVKTKTSHGQREISDDLIAKMAQQVKINRSEFLNLIECSLSRQAYENRLISMGLVAAGNNQ